MKIVQNNESPSKVTLSCLCAVLLHPYIWSIFVVSAVVTRDRF